MTTTTRADVSGPSGDVTSDLAALFPGQGSQYPRMAVDLRRHPEGARILRRAEEASDLDLGRIAESGTTEELARPDVAQVVVVTFSLAVLARLRAAGITPAVVAGHSVGEYAALVAAGMLAQDDALELVAVRGRLMAEAAGDDGGTMAAVVGLDAARVEALCAAAGDQPVVVANLNSARQTVVSGTVAGVEEVCARAAQEGAVRARRLNVGAAYHSPLMAAADEEMARRWATVRLAPPAGVIVSSVTGEVVTDPERHRELMRYQLGAPVAWTATMRSITDREPRAAIEVGPGRVLGGLCREHEPRLDVLRCDHVLRAAEARR